MPARYYRGTVLALVAALLALGAWRLPDVTASPDEAQEVARLINHERAARGLPPLSLDPMLSSAAQQHSDDLAAHNIFSHTGSDGRGFWERVLASGYPAYFGGEVVAAGYGSATDVVSGWMGSPDHQHILLLPDAAQLGVGHAQRGGTAYGHYWTVEVSQPVDGYVVPAP